MSRQTPLLEAAAAALVAHGTRVSARDIARSAEVNYGLVSHYFGSRDRLLVQAFRLLHDRRGERPDDFSHATMRVLADIDWLAANRLPLREAFGDALPALPVFADAQRLIDLGVDPREAFARSCVARMVSYGTDLYWPSIAFLVNAAGVALSEERVREIAGRVVADLRCPPGD